MASHYEAPIRRPLVTGEKSYHDVTVDVAKPVEGKANKQWWIVFSIALSSFPLGYRMYYLYHFNRYWNLGFEQNCRLGLGYY